MTDRISPEHRSWNMSRIRNRDTKPELIVRSLLHRMGYRFRLHRKDLPGKPDIVLPKYRTVIFVHGCFWHRHHNCRYASTPQSHTAFWNAKFATTIERDREVRRQLRKLAWHVIVVWECEITAEHSLQKKISTFLRHY
ncbi:very short patch repair endonuclease [Planctopirus hydrillae]|uniref:very short patch repair endonuclease n=1 Tax=Planctopirus hydrillae TaxID=1841610 RepID=UPI0009F3A91F|nr:DNA mismatch endonuclease Vsr [Planctopirus hydrillae]